MMAWHKDRMYPLYSIELISVCQCVIFTHLFERNILDTLRQSEIDLLYYIIKFSLRQSCLVREITLLRNWDHAVHCCIDYKSYFYYFKIRLFPSSWSQLWLVRILFQGLAHTDFTFISNVFTQPLIQFLTFYKYVSCPYDS